MKRTMIARTAATAALLLALGGGAAVAQNDPNAGTGAPPPDATTQTTSNGPHNGSMQTNSTAAGDNNGTPRSAGTNAGAGASTTSTTDTTGSPANTGKGAPPQITNKTEEGIPTAARASGAGYKGALEPWLVWWLLPISGLLSVGVATGIDRRVRNERVALHRHSRA